MGNQHGKKDAKSPFNRDELDILQKTFQFLAGERNRKLMETQLVESWSNVCDEHLARCMGNFLYNIPSSSKDSVELYARAIAINFDTFIKPLYYVKYGTLNEKVDLIINSINNRTSDSVKINELQLYSAAVLKSYFCIKKKQQSANFKPWHGFKNSPQILSSLSRTYFNFFEINKILLADDIEKWLQLNPTLLNMWAEVLLFLYSYCGQPNVFTVNHLNDNHIIPLMTDFPSKTHYTSILDLSHVTFLNSNLPNELNTQWRFLFSSKIMGESFSTMLSKMLYKGPTLLIIEDEDNCIFGGYAPNSWSLSPNFIGDESAMLFTLNPVMQCFSTTGYNNHYQYLNLNQETMPNGLGGQFNYWGLWLDCEYGKGHSMKSCTTFKNYTQLSGNQYFRIRTLEVWSIGPEPITTSEVEATNPSVLDKNLEDRVMLELSGHNLHSDGLRELNN